MLKIFLLVFVVYSVHCWEARSWTGRDWQSNSGGNLAWGWGGDGSRGWDDGKRGGGGGWEGKGWNDDDGKYQWAPAKYEFGYGVADPKTGDKKEQTEERIKDKVVGQYSLEEPDGTRRIVKYEADDKNGFNAKVIQEGKAWHPAGNRGWGKW